ncbi:hypothetical protein FB45DRAFT_879492 [Roridomyces roridus]|uniref:Uncharacterized protein n=1 Tax=Roridomyces roridus TaxID=1738132 RepID=A0AAD7AZV8_9AGAR|nr:hypothetical protein FB45DRAFT_879492 [Roridomyces roridus]
MYRLDGVMVDPMQKSGHRSELKNNTVWSRGIYVALFLYLGHWINEVEYPRLHPGTPPECTQLPVSWAQDVCPMLLTDGIRMVVGWIPALIFNGTRMDPALAGHGWSKELNASCRVIWRPRRQLPVAHMPVIM